MVRLNARKEIELTRRGEQAAAAIVRRHRIMERWLTDGLGLDWVTADEEAARLEHAVSQAVEDRVYKLLGNPLTCPHGNAIPGHATPRRDERPLSRLRAGESGAITRISEVAQREAPPLLHYLHERHLVPRTRVRIREVDQVGRTLRLAVAGRELTLSAETASKIWVAPLR